MIRGTAERHDPRELVADGLMTVRDAQRFLGVGHSMLYQLMGRGEIPYVRIGTARRIPRAALVEYAARHLRGGAA